MARLSSRLSASAVFGATLTLQSFSGSTPSALGAAVDFSKEIRPILSNNCFHCHGPDDKNRKGAGEKGFRLDTAEGAFQALESGFAIVPKHPERSALLERLHSTDSDEVMPPPKTGKKLTLKEKELIKKWIEEGAQYSGHWAYAKPERKEPQEVNNAGWNRHPVDRFLYRRLQAEGLQPAAEADKATLARRVALDLTGLPPTLEDLVAFERDHSADAFPRFVDRVLGKPAFGEHWARLWMDLARYADSAGYPSDPGRSIWAYRDYVIRAFNQNKPFDQFTIEQLAGDLLPNATEEQIIATAFHRNTMTNNEGGTSDEEFRNAAVVDRVSTTWSVWMGTSMACAQCHTHKFDPLSQKEFFQFFAIFNQTEDADRPDESPLHQFYLPEEKQNRDALEQKLAGLEAKFKAPSAQWRAGFEGWDRAFPRSVEWSAPVPRAARAERGSKSVLRPDGSIQFEVSDKGAETYFVELPLAGGTISALRLETVADPGAPAKGAGLGANGAFTLDALRGTLVADGRAGREARYVRVELTGATRPLQIAELEVLSGGENIARAATSKASPVQGEAVPERAIDGKTEGGSAALVTRGEKPGEFLELDLGAIKRVERVRVHVPTTGGYYLGGFKVVLLDEHRKELWTRVESDLRENLREFEPSHGEALKFRAVYASGANPAFELPPVAGLKPKDAANRNKGWNVPNSTKPQRLTLILEKPVHAPAGAVLRVELDQQSRKRDQHLASFALKVTAEEGAELAAALPAAIEAVGLMAPEKRAEKQSAQWLDYYVRTYAPEAAADREELAASKKELDALKPNTVPVMRELDSAKRRLTRVQLRGNFQNLGEEVEPGTPAVFAPAAQNSGGTVDRLTMARWLVGPENPLTARVIANRFWESIFGIGIVRTSEEFGVQGELPFHPELLDWLATELVRTGWDVKAFLKLLVTSAAYRQASVVTPEAREKDPENRLLSRGPRFRPTGEVLRDQALAVGGLLSPAMYGKPVRPPKPDLGLSTAFGRGNDWIASTGEDRYRRAIYTEVRRNSPYPSFTTFDAPNREVCTIRRNRTNTPLQALVSLNDPVFIEAAQALARRILKEAPESREQQLRHAFKLVLARDPSVVEIARLGRLLEEAFQDFSADPARARRMAAEPLGPLPKDASVPEYAAWTALANTLLNLDETLMRR